MNFLVPPTNNKDIRYSSFQYIDTVLLIIYGGGIMDFENSKTLGDWEKWKRTLSGAVNLGETVGFSERTIDNIAFRVGNALSASVDPENREQRVLQELWKTGDDSDRQTLAKLIVKMVQVDDK
jgi:hypothetical protein